MTEEAGVLFIHGTASSGHIWAKLLESRVAEGTGAVQGTAPSAETGLRDGDMTASAGRLVSRVRGPVLTPDIPGMGDARVRSDLPLSFDHWLDHFRRLAGGRPMHLVGHSLGGAIAVHLAPEPWVASVALIAPATRSYCEERRRTSRAGANPGSILLSGPLGNLVADPSALSRSEARMLREDYAKAAPLLSAGVPWPPYPLDEAAYLRGKRVLLIYGEEDAVVPVRYFARMREQLESASVHVVVRALPGCGHIPQLERAEEVAGSLMAFWVSASAHREDG